jgi:hypothetical protein
MGVDSATLWSGIPENNSSFNFKWYGGTTQIASLDGTGNLSAAGNVTGGNVLTGGLISASGHIYGNNLTLNSGNINGTGTAITINGGSPIANVDFAVNGETIANVFYVNAATDTASFGNSTQISNSIVAFNATNSIKMPVGNTSQRPAGITGQFRFNTTINSLEVYDNSTWTNVGSPAFTVIMDQQFSGDGSTVAFTLTDPSTTAGSVVSINGVVQIPTTAYSISTTTLTFTEAPAAGDQIDVRTFTTTTSVTSIQNGNASIVANGVPAGGEVDINGNTIITGTLSVSGGIVGLASNKISSGTSQANIGTPNGNLAISIGGTSNVAVFSSGLLAITGDLSVSGNATLSGNILGDRIQNGTTTIDIQTASGNANITVGGTSNVAVFAPTALYITGNISATGDVIAQNVNSLSDATLKTNITPIENAGAVVDGLNGVGYDWTNGSGHAYGLIAQKVEEVLPEAVKTDENGIKSVNYSMVIPFLIETVKELRQDIAEIKAQLKK